MDVARIPPVSSSVQESFARSENLVREGAHYGLNQAPEGFAKAYVNFKLARIQQSMAIATLQVQDALAKAGLNMIA